MLGNGLVYEKCVFCGDEFFRCNCFLKVGENSKIAKFDTFFIYIVASSFYLLNLLITFFINSEIILMSFFIESFSNWLTLFFFVLAQFNFKVAMSELIESFSN